MCIRLKLGDTERVMGRLLRRAGRKGFTKSEKKKKKEDGTNYVTCLLFLHFQVFCICCLFFWSLNAKVCFLRRNTTQCCKGNLESFLYFRWNSFLLLLLLFKIIYFNWRLITLHYCGGFCHTSTWISHGLHVSPHPEPTSHCPSHPIPLGCPRGFVCPASCIKLAPVICFTYGNIHVSMLFSQIIPPSPSLT